MNSVQFSYISNLRPREIIYYEMNTDEFESFLNNKKDMIKYIHIEKMICSDKECANRLINIAHSLSRHK